MTIKWKLEKRKVKDLFDYHKNPREFTEKGLKDLEKSIKTIGLAQPININTENVILSGHARVLKLKEMGVEEVDCYVPHRKLTEKEEEEIVIRMNANTAGIWDFDILEKDFELTELEDWGMEDLEFGLEEEDEDEIKEVGPVKLKKESIVQKGDVWFLGENKLKCGDCTNADDVKSLIQDEKSTMIFTDPPFNIGYDYNDYKDNKSEQDYYQMLKDSISLFVNDNISVYIMQKHKNTFLQWKILLELGLEYANMIIWRSTSQAHPKKRFQSFYQPILFFRTKEFKYKEFAEKRKEPENYFGKKKFKGKMNDFWDDIKPCQSGFLKRKGEEERQHPAQMPIKLPARAIKFSSEKGDIVVDMFGGSGSTLLACEQLGRKGYLFEQDPIYCQVVIDRYKKLKKNKVEDMFVLRDGKKINYKDLTKNT